MSNASSTRGGFGAPSQPQTDRASPFGNYSAASKAKTTATFVQPSVSPFASSGTSSNPKTTRSFPTAASPFANSDATIKSNTTATFGQPSVSPFANSDSVTKPNTTANFGQPSVSPFANSDAVTKPNTTATFGQPSVGKPPVSLFANSGTPYKPSSSTIIGQPSSNNGSSFEPRKDSRFASLFASPSNITDLPAETSNLFAMPSPADGLGGFGAALQQPKAMESEQSSTMTSRQVEAPWPISTTKPLPPANGFSAPSGPKTSFAQVNVASVDFSSHPKLMTRPFPAPAATLAPNVPKPVTMVNSSFGSPTTSALLPKKVNFAVPPDNSPYRPLKTAEALQSTALATSINNQTRKANLVAPPWPKSPGEPVQKDAMYELFQAFKEYRNKVRTTLVRAGLVDDPDKPKKLSEAIEFKGICEDMCPEFEKVTRIHDSDVRAEEKDINSNGQPRPNLDKMVKALARSAAGQEAPLPMDVRSPGALRRTVDYLLDKLLGDEEGKLPKVHGFLWDRTRAIRRDFVFQSSLTSSELLDHVYCLERITRFHVISLHIMSDPAITKSDFVAQQEAEQLGNTMLSLIHAYEDCSAKGIHCKNEAEFRAYYAVLKARASGILETVQDWGFDFWESDDVQLAVSLVETLQNIWDEQGPLRPYSTTEVALNAYGKFFTIIKDPSVSYTIACFAEMHFNDIRHAALLTIAQSNKIQGGCSPKDWTPEAVNQYLCFDEIEDMISFVEKCGMQFDRSESDELLLDLLGVPQLPSLIKQPHSKALVEQKRGHHSLPFVFTNTVYGDIDDASSRFDVVTDSIVSEPVKPSESTPATSIINSTSQWAFPTSGDFDVAQPDTVPVTQPLQNPSLGSGNFPTQATPNNSVATESQSQPSMVRPQAPWFLSSVAPAAPYSAAVPAPDSFSQIAPPPVAAPEVALVPPQSVVQNTAPVLTSEPQLESLGTGSQLPNLPAMASTQFSSTAPAPMSQQSLFQPMSLTPPKPVPATSQSSAHALFESPFSSSQAAVGQNAGPSAREARKTKLDGINNWYVCGSGGVIDQLTEHWAFGIVRDVFLEFEQEQAEQAAQAAAEKSAREADEHRYRVVATKFYRKWCTATRDNYLDRRAKFARKALEEAVKQRRAAKLAKPENLVEGFRASVSKPRRGSLESLLGQNGGDCNGFLNPRDGIRATICDEMQAINRKNKQRQIQPQKNIRRPRTERSSNTPSSRTPVGKTSSAKEPKRDPRDDPRRRSLFSNSSYLSGESRSLHMKGQYDNLDDTRPNYNGVQTDYFRLKARGIKTMPDGRQMASSVAKILNQKRSLESLNRIEGKENKPVASLERSLGSLEGDQNGHKRRRTSDEALDSQYPRELTEARDLFATLKEPGDEQRKPSETVDSNYERGLAGARDLLAKMNGLGDKKRKSVVDPKEEELFARAKRVREELDHDIEWVREETKRWSSSRDPSSPAFR
ncbi:SAC3/GANP/Nin1/mts3/eIF-3 p25 family-domain-containing protein [Calycina marina]|uniref:SAC3/GANP/Nin1/mts3/eIF-3 p25 family-domain-containing protein n=1 Tax=Calycina marina TaxID=1763456 RepID=A0A9P7Z6M1_9HELO|nr:SAC3/GANP/Nin1/mts3/eIF-3 p25 family-domain-containing protein [Calycina marina]